MTYEEFAKKVLEAFNKSNVNYAIIGGLAAIYYGRPRTTVDIDIVILIEKEKMEKFCQNISKFGFKVNPLELKKAFEEKSHISLFLEDYPFRIDLKGCYNTLDKASLENKRKAKIFNKDAWIESAEDIVIAKLVYGAEHDIEDAITILKRQKKLSYRYLIKRAKQEKVLKKLKNIQAKI